MCCKQMDDNIARTGLLVMSFASIPFVECHWPHSGESDHGRPNPALLAKHHRPLNETSADGGLQFHGGGLRSDHGRPNPSLLTKHHWPLNETSADGGLQFQGGGLRADGDLPLELTPWGSLLV